MANALAAQPRAGSRTQRTDSIPGLRLPGAMARSLGGPQGGSAAPGEPSHGRSGSFQPPPRTLARPGGEPGRGILDHSPGSRGLAGLEPALRGPPTMGRSGEDPGPGGRSPQSPGPIPARRRPPETGRQRLPGGAASSALGGHDGAPRRGYGLPGGRGPRPGPGGSLQSPLLRGLAPTADAHPDPLPPSFVSPLPGDHRPPGGGRRRPPGAPGRLGGPRRRRPAGSGAHRPPGRSRALGRSLEPLPHRPGPGPAAPRGSIRRRSFPPRGSCGLAPPAGVLADSKGAGTTKRPRRSGGSGLEGAGRLVGGRSGSLRLAKPGGGTGTAWSGGRGKRPEPCSSKSPPASKWAVSSRYLSMGVPSAAGPSLAEAPCT